MSADFESGVLTPDWLALGRDQRRVRALMTMRPSPPGIGASAGPFAALDGSPGLNLGLGSGEHLDIVLGNRERLSAQIGVPICWINQVHGTGVAQFKAAPNGTTPSADGAFTTEAGIALAVLVADCLPVLFADEGARCVAVAHAGWRGLAGGVLESVVAALPKDRGPLHAWLGPAIGKDDFEVGEDVLDAFAQVDPNSKAGFRPKAAGKWYGDLPWLARRRLSEVGVTVHDQSSSTVADAKRFYSFRRDKVTGRMAALIWLEERPDR